MFVALETESLAHADVGPSSSFPRGGLTWGNILASPAQNHIYRPKLYGPQTEDVERVNKWLALLPFGQRGAAGPQGLTLHSYLAVPTGRAES